MVGEEALRLLREKWPNATMLAEELYVILSSPDIPITTSAPITYNQPAGSSAPALTLNMNPDATGPAIQINPGDGGPTITIGPDNIDLGGGFLLGQGLNLQFLGTQALGGGTNTNPGPGGGGGGQQPSASSAMPGQIQSGTGTTYTVTIYPSGLSGSTQNVTVTQLQIDNTQAIPAGTWVLVTQNGGNYYMQSPVWL
jgi:hypothetical protein